MSSSRIEAGTARLSDYLRIASRDALSFELHVRLGAIECGKVAIRAGVVVHSELPGAIGEPALELLARIPNARFEITSLGAAPTTLERPWTAVLGVLDLHDDDASRRHLQVYGELRELGLGPTTLELTDPTEPRTLRYSSLQSQRATRSAALLLRRAGLLAYLAGDLERARRCYERVLAMRPHDLESRANVERIRARLLLEQGLRSLEVVACD